MSRVTLVLATVLSFVAGALGQCDDGPGMNMCEGGTARLTFWQPYTLRVGGSWPCAPCSCSIISDLPAPVVVLVDVAFKPPTRGCNGDTRLRTSRGVIQGGKCGYEWSKYIAVTQKKATIEYLYDASKTQADMCAGLRLVSSGNTEVYVVCGTGIKQSKADCLASLTTRPPPVITTKRKTTLRPTTTTTVTPTTSSTTTSTTTTTVTTSSTTLTTRTSTPTTTRSTTTTTATTTTTPTTTMTTRSTTPTTTFTTTTTPSTTLSNTTTTTATTTPVPSTAITSVEHTYTTTTSIPSHFTVASTAVARNTSFSHTTTEPSPGPAANATRALEEENMIIVVLSLSSCAAFVLLVIIVMASIHFRSRKRVEEQHQSILKHMENGKTGQREHVATVNGNMVEKVESLPKMPSLVKMMSTRSTWTNPSNVASSIYKNGDSFCISDDTFYMSPYAVNPSYGYELPHSTPTENSVPRYQPYKSSTDILVRQPQSAKPTRKNKSSKAHVRKTQSDIGTHRPRMFQTEAGIVRNPIQAAEYDAITWHAKQDQPQRPIHLVSDPRNRYQVLDVNGPAGTSTPLDNTLNTKVRKSTSNSPALEKSPILTSQANNKSPLQNNTTNSQGKDYVSSNIFIKPNVEKRDSGDVNDVEGNPQVMTFSAEEVEIKDKKTKYIKNKKTSSGGDIHRDSYRESLMRQRASNREESGSDWQSDGSARSRAKQVSFGAVLTVHSKPVPETNSSPK